MQKIPYETVLNIQKKTDIVDVIGEYLPLQQKGKNYFAICPFHDDHNPSMSISSEKQIYTCFVCGASGNVFNFVMNYEKISFGQAVCKIASRLNISLDYDYNAPVKKVNDTYDKFYKMFELANKFYQNNIKTIYAKDAIKYLHDRNLSDDVIKTFEIGLCFDDGGLYKLLSNKKYAKDDILELGLAGVKDNFTYDTFRNRIMFPIHNPDGLVVGFSGRIYGNSKDSKYVNSKESIIFKKGLILYNYHRALKYCRDSKMVIVVEGFMDVIRLYTVGIKNVVATMGTAITKNHADLIRKLSKNVVLCFDGDKAGKKATLSAMEALKNIGIDPKIIRLEDDLDPDEYILKKDKEHFLNHLNNAMTSFDFMLDEEKENTNFNDLTEVSNYVSMAAKEIEKIDDEVLRELTIKKIAKQTNVDIETIKSLINKNIKSNKVRFIKPKVTFKDKYTKAEEYLVYYMLNDVDAINIYKDNTIYLSNRTLSMIAYEIEDFYDKNGYISATDFTLFLADKTDLINETLRIDALALPIKSSNDQIMDYIKTIKSGIRKREINKLKNEITTEVNVAKKVALLEKMTLLKKKESEYSERN